MLDHEVDHLGDICTMQVIVIGHITPVSLVDRTKELDCLVVVD